MVNMVEIGSTHCKPCQMMMPILEDLKKVYKGRVAVAFIDVDKYPQQAQKLQIMTIPTQIIYDRQGKEVLRHIGFFPEDQLTAELDRILGAG